MLKRIVPLVAVLALLLPCLLVPASAYDVVNYLDLVESVKPSGDDVIITLKLPTSDFYWSVYNNNTDDEIRRGNGNYMSVSGLNSTVPYTCSFVYKWLETAQFPVGSVFTFNTTIDYNSISSCYFQPRLGFSNDTYDRANEDLIFGDSLYWFRDGQRDDLTYTSSVVLSATDYKYMSVISSFTNLYCWQSTGKVIINLNSCYVTFTLSALEYQVAEGQKDSALLEQISGSLDELINRPANPKPPAGADNVTNAGQKEDQLLNSGAAGRDEFNNMLGGSAASLELYTSSFAFLSACMNPIIDIPWIKEILTISLGLGLTGFLLNLGISAISKAGKDGGKSSGKGGGK